MEQGTHEQNNITVEMEITLSTAPGQIREVEGIGNDDDDNDADFVPGSFRGSLKEFRRINVILPIINSKTGMWGSMFRTCLLPFSQTNQ